MNKRYKHFILYFISIILVVLFIAKIEEISTIVHNAKLTVVQAITNLNKKETVITLPPFEAESNAWYSNDFTMIAHAAGGIEGKTYVQSKECLEQALSNNYQFIELDLQLTSDGKVAIRDTWDTRQYEVVYNTSPLPSYQDYLSKKIFYKFTSMSLEDIFIAMRENSELYVITDGDLIPTITELVNTCKELGYEDVLSHIIVQIYFNGDYEAVQNIYPFNNFIYTLYQQSTRDYSSIIQYCLENNIHVVTMPHDEVTQEVLSLFDNYNIHVYVHTVNSLLEIDELSQLGVSGFYTDFITPDDLQYIQ